MISSDWRNALEPVDYVRSGVLVVAFFATAFGSAETWIQADTLAMAVFGSAWVLFPHQLLDFQTDVNLDYMHSVFGQVIGVTMLSMAAFNFMNRKSRDPNVWLAVYLSRIVGGFAWLTTQCLAMPASKNQKGWTIQHCTFGALASTLYLAGNVIQAWKSTTYSTSSSQRGVGDHLSKHLLLTLLLEVLGIFQFYSHTDQLTSHFFAKEMKYDIVHGDLAKYGACIWMCASLMTLASLNFEDNKARKNLILLKFLVILVMAILDVLLQVRFSPYKKDMFVWEIVQYIPFLLITGLGYFHSAKHM